MLIGDDPREIPFGDVDTFYDKVLRPHGMARLSPDFDEYTLHSNNLMWHELENTLGLVKGLKKIESWMKHLVPKKQLPKIEEELRSLDAAALKEEQVLRPGCLDQDDKVGMIVDRFLRADEDQDNEINQPTIIVAFECEGQHLLSRSSVVVPPAFLFTV